MTSGDVSAVLELLGIRLARLRPDLSVCGSPDRCLERTAAEDAQGNLWVVERHHLSEAARKQSVAAAEAHLAAQLPEVRAPLAFAPGRFLAERDGGAWQVRPYFAGVALDRPGFAFDGWRGEALAGLLVRFRAASAGLPAPGRDAGAAAPGPFSLADFVRGLMDTLRDRRRPLFERLHPAAVALERELFPALAGLPEAFAHGDFHPLNVVWGPAGINALVDFEFCGPRPETYDAALLVGCVGMEDPRALGADLVLRFVGRLGAEAGFSAAGWRSFPALVAGLRFAWLSEWLRRDDREMIDLEAVYIGLLMERREALARAWGRG